MPPHSEKESANLDVLRATAVLSVYLGHLLQLWDVVQIGPISTREVAQTGVLVFFTHTSLVLMLSMQRQSGGPLALMKSFYVRRAFRIYPLSMLVVASTALASIPAFPSRPYAWNGWSDFFANLGLVQNLTQSPSLLDPLWSLPYEVQMYLLLPPLFFLVRRVGRPWLLAVVWLGGVLLATIQEHANLSSLGLARYAPCFLAGVVAYGLFQRKRAALPFAGWVGVIAMAFLLRQFGLQAGWLACLLLAVAVPHFRELEVRWLKVLSSLIARFSYGIYLSHLVVFWVAFVALNRFPAWAQVVSCVVLSVGLPVGLYYGLEKPMIDLGGRLAGRWTSSATVGVQLPKT